MYDIWTKNKLESKVSPGKIRLRLRLRRDLAFLDHVGALAETGLDKFKFLLGVLSDQ